MKVDGLIKKYKMKTKMMRIMILRGKMMTTPKVWKTKRSKKKTSSNLKKKSPKQQPKNLRRFSSRCLKNLRMLEEAN